MDSPLEQCRAAFGDEAIQALGANSATEDVISHTPPHLHKNMNNQVSLLFLPCLSSLVFDSSGSSVQLSQSLLIQLFLIASVYWEV